MQESCENISQYLAGKKRNIETHVWSTKDDDPIMGEVPQGNGVLRVFDLEKRKRVNNYCMLNSEHMQKS